MKALHTKSAPAAIGPYSQAIEVNGFVLLPARYLLIRLPGICRRRYQRADRQALTNAAHIMAEAGIDLSHVVKTTVFFGRYGRFCRYERSIFHFL